MRRRVLITLLAMVTTVLAAAPAAHSGQRPRCTIGLELAGPRKIGFHTRCNFEQTQVKLRVAGEPKGVDRNPSLSGRVDPEDEFACARKARRINCTGRAGEGVRLDGGFRTVGPACDVRVDLTIFGGIDCEPGQACAAIGYFDGAQDIRPPGC